MDGSLGRAFFLVSLRFQLTLVQDKGMMKAPGWSGDRGSVCGVEESPHSVEQGAG
jgi:hypothetical protein